MRSSLELFPSNLPGIPSSPVEAMTPGRNIRYDSKHQVGEHTIDPRDLSNGKLTVGLGKVMHQDLVEQT